MQLFLNLVIPYCKSYFSFFCLLLVYFHLLLSYFIQFFFPCPLSVAYCSYNSIILRASVPQQDLWDWRAGSCKLWGPLIGPFSWVLSSGQSSSHQLWIFLSSSFFSTSFLAPPTSSEFTVPQHIPHCCHPCRPMDLSSHGWLERHLCMAICHHLSAPIDYGDCPHVCPLHYQNTHSLFWGTT